MNDTATDWTLLGVSSNFGHYIVPCLLLNFVGTADVYLLHLTLQIGQLLFGDQSSLVLRRGQSQPHLPH
jgi:hypothetical protein